MTIPKLSSCKVEFGVKQFYPDLMVQLYPITRVAVDVGPQYTTVRITDLTTEDMQGIIDCLESEIALRKNFAEEVGIDLNDDETHADVSAHV